ncbi:hypothetical protein [Pedobacter frigoris]|uniref:hypothetical protein n=1 Tax=Pedobacter frigoris TaxID=2571272 RepID=UPI002930CFA6|nr:hypothetical protein [Pedobacter frigoris]
MIRLLILIVCSLSCHCLSAQTVITGTVSNKSDGKPLGGTTVTIKEKAAVLVYGVTNEKGDYKLSFKSEEDSLQLTVAGLNFKKQTLMFANKSQNLNFAITSETIKLKEIKIKPPKIRQLNDTLNYLVDAFSDQNDRSIGDVLKKMPGITVKEDGAIFYNNKPINKFYIENKDLLQGRYGIATNNIQAKDVATVQVLENHQPIKALKDKEFTDEGAINLKLKDGAKGVLTANAQLGAGASPVLWNNELTSMYFNKDRQNMNAYKGNNSGLDAGAELASFYGGSGGASQSGSLYVQSPSSPGISQKRYLFNRSHAATVNNLWAYDKDFQVTANVNYLNDNQEKESYSRSVYYLPGDSMLTIEESLASTKQINSLDGSLQINANRDKYYMDNTLRFNGKWTAEKGNVLNGSELVQRLNSPAFSLNNNFSIIRNYKKATLKVYSYNAYSQAPQTLKVQPLLYPELFNQPGASDIMQQYLRESQFSSTSRVVYGLDHGSFKHNYGVGFNANLQNFRSDLQSLSDAGVLSGADDSLKNDIQWNTYEVFISPDYSYTKNKLRASLNLPLTYNYLNVVDRFADHDKNSGRLFFNPSFSLRYELTLLWNVSFRAQRSNSIGGLSNGFSGYILQSYRSLVRNESDLPERQAQSYSLDVSYRHPLHAIFFNFGTSYSKNKSNLLYGYDYSGIRSQQRTYNLTNYNEGYNLFGKISKGIDVIASTLVIDVNYSGSKASQISQGEIVNFRNENYGVNPSISTRIKKLGSLSYSYQYNRSKNKTAQGEKFSPINSIRQRGQFNFFPAKSMTLNMSLEHFYNSAIRGENGADQSMYFADLGARYTWKRIEFNLEYNNVFNTKQYISASYSDISTFYTSYILRPAQVMMKVRFKVL